MMYEMYIFNRRNEVILNFEKVSQIAKRLRPKIGTASTSIAGRIRLPDLAPLKNVPRAFHGPDIPGRNRKPQPYPSRKPTPGQIPKPKVCTFIGYPIYFLDFLEII